MSFHEVADAAPAIIWQTDLEGSCIYRSRAWREFTGQAASGALGFGWMAAVHEDDRADLQRALHQAILSRLPFSAAYRVRRADGSWRHIADAANPHFNADGELLGFVGVARDETERKEAEEAGRFIGRELAHRIKNIFAMISGLVGLSAREHEDAQPFASDLRDRLAALSRAHHFALPQEPGTTELRDRQHLLQVLLDMLFEPYSTKAEGARIAISADDVSIGAGSAVTVAMMLHELTTNALKYGALSGDNGRVALEGRLDGEVYVLSWEESGGPLIKAPPLKTGFGTIMVQRAACLQLKASCDYDWRPNGLKLTIRIPVAALAV